MDNIEQIKQKKVQEAEEVFKILYIDNNYQVLAPYRGVAPDKVIYPYRAPYRIDPYRIIPPNRQNENMSKEKKKLHKTRLSNSTKPLPVIE